MKRDVGLMDYFNSIFLTIIIIGMGANFKVMTSNDGKMPVEVDSLQELLGYETIVYEGYLLFDDKEDIKYYYLSDILPFFNLGLFSIGDVFMIVGVMGLLTNVFYHLFFILKKRKKERNVFKHINL